MPGRPTIPRSTALVLSLVLTVTQAAAEPATIEADELKVGLSSVEISPPPGVPLAGYSHGARRGFPIQWSRDDPYAFFFRPATGVHDPIQARAMVVKRGTARLVFVRLDLIGVGAALVSALRLRLADLNIPEGHLIVTATHTHSGPGAWADSRVWALIATDRYRQEIFDQIVDGAERAVRRAEAALVPGLLFATSFSVDRIHRNRRDANVPIDHVANVLLARTRDGRWLGGLVNFAIHPTALSARNLAFSADVTGAIERHFETRLQALNGSADPATLLFINGALGDVGPTGSDFEGIEWTGQVFAEAASRAMQTLRKVPPRWEIATATFDLGKPRLPLKPCLGPAWPANLLGETRLPVDDLLSGRTDLHLVLLGDMAMMSWPGEPTSALGLALHRQATQAGAKQTWVLGLTGDYKSYFTTPDEFARGSYEACRSFFGPEAGERIIAAYRDLLTRSADPPKSE